MKKSIKHSLSLLLCLNLLLIVSCDVKQVSRAQLSLAPYTIRITDLPDGWKYDGDVKSEKFGGEIYTIGFVPSENSIVSIGHTVAIYSDKEKAKTAYLEWEADNFGKNWGKWPGADFVPVDPNDQYKYECIEVLSDIVTCDCLQQHNQFIAHISVNIDAKSITLAQFNELLGVLDKRLSGSNQ